MVGETHRPCKFCTINQETNNKNHLTELGLPRLDTIPLFESDNINVFSDILPSHKKGLHFLIVPKSHRPAFANLGYLKDEVGYMIARIEREFGVSMIRGEHGGGNPNLGYQESKLQSIYHPHMHLFGNEDRLDIIEYMKEVLKNKEKVPFKLFVGLDGTPVSLLQMQYTGHPYLFVQQGNMAIWAEDKKGQFPSQILQRNISYLFNGEVLNWKNIPNKPDLAKLSAQRIVRAFESCRLR